MSIPTLERFRGCLLGLATGDALGTTLEFCAPGSFQPIQDLIGGGPFHLKPGEWTDDTSMALCLADSLIACQGFNPVDQLERYVRWYRKGYLSSNGRCFDIGATVRAALHHFESTRDPDSGPIHSNSAGNGSLMRLAPVPMFFASDPEKAIEKSGQSSPTTHGAAAAVDACRYFGGLLAGALNGIGKETLLSSGYSPVPGGWQAQAALHPAIAEIAAGSFKGRRPPEIVGSGYVVRSLEAALWAFFHTNSFREGCLAAVNLGNDADTTGAVYGQLAGAYYGEQAIPESWRLKLALRGQIEGFASQLLH
jgi:ADP-ribosyl-[dinitrogen reductase] hydrolase